MNYYLLIDGEEQGPYTLQQIQEAINNGTIHDQQIARAEDSIEWKTIATIACLKMPKELASVASNSTPVATTRLPMSKSPDHLFHLARIRKNSCYGMLRGIIEVIFFISLLGVIGYVLFAGISSLNGGHGGFGIIGLIAGVLGVMLLIAAREATLLLIDIADTLIYEHSQHK